MSIADNVWNVVTITSGHLVVRWVDLPLGEIIIPDAVVDLRYCVIKKSDNFIRGARIAISRCSIIKNRCSFIIFAWYCSRVT